MSSTIHNDIYSLLNVGKIQEAEKMYIEYITKNRNDDRILRELCKGFIGFPAAHPNITRTIDFHFRKFMNDILCMIDFPPALNELAWAYLGLDGDEMDMYGITDRDLKLSLQLYKRSADLGSYYAYRHLVEFYGGLYQYGDELYFYNNSGHEIRYDGPLKTFFKEQQKKYLINGMKIYKERGSDFLSLVSYEHDEMEELFDCVSNDILCEIVEKDMMFVFDVPKKHQTAPMYVPFIKSILNIP